MIFLFDQLKNCFQALQVAHPTWFSQPITRITLEYSHAKSSPLPTVSRQRSCRVPATSTRPTSTRSAKSSPGSELIPSTWASSSNPTAPVATTVSTSTSTRTPLPRKTSVTQFARPEKRSATALSGLVTRVVRSTTKSLVAKMTTEAARDAPRPPLPADPNWRKTTRLNGFPKLAALSLSFFLIYTRSSLFFIEYITL